jgi:hypothetical protein
MKKSTKDTLERENEKLKNQPSAPPQVIKRIPTPASVPAEPPLAIHATLNAMPSDPRYPAEKVAMVIVVTNRQMNGGRVRIECDKVTIKQGSASVSGFGVTTWMGGGLLDEHTYESGVAFENWTPEQPLLVWLYYDGNINDLRTCKFMLPQ